jgi:pimeloyl-ACP methyl ester carboxylesterase
MEGTMPQCPWQVILLPGSVMPAGPAYGALLAELGSDVDARPKELEVYAAETPPAGYSLANEVDGISRVADEAGFERFHLVGYSGGGAACLAYTADHPERLLSLALMEPAFAGWQMMTLEEHANFERFRPLLAMDGPEQMARFQALQLAPGVAPSPPPPGPPPPWMALRPAGVRAFLATFLSSDMDLDALRKFERPVWYALGGLSHPDYYARMADRLAGVFPDFTVEVFPDRHHFDPPHRIEPHRVAASLRALWSRAEGPVRPDAGMSPDLSPGGTGSADRSTRSG